MKKNKNLDTLISSVERQMIASEPDSDEYNVLLGRLARLKELRDGKSERISPNTVLIVGGNLAGILAILTFEKTGVVVSKALGFIMKPKS